MVTLLDGLDTLLRNALGVMFSVSRMRDRCLALGLRIVSSRASIVRKHDQTAMLHATFTMVIKVG
jgi:hypothetical protein